MHVERFRDRRSARVHADARLQSGGLEHLLVYEFLRSLGSALNKRAKDPV